MNDLYLNIDFLIRLIVAVICGGLIGFERGETKHEAGLRTHILVCLGAALIMVVSEAVVREYEIKTEIMRMGAQIVSGIGFLGAGSIIVDGNRIRGITTAAGIWTTACVGIAVGAGYYVIGIFVVILMLVVMHSLKPLISKLRSNSSKCTLSVKLSDENDINTLLLILSKHDIGVNNLKVIPNIEGKTVEISMLPIEDIDKRTLISELEMKISGFELNIT